MKKVTTLLIALMLILSISVPAFAANSAFPSQMQSRNLNQTQDKSDTEAGKECTQAQEQARLAIRIKLKISDSAKAQKHENDQKNNQVHVYSCPNDTIYTCLKDTVYAIFKDTDLHWAKIQIKAAYSWGLINGYRDGRFSPNGKITGTEATLMVGRLRKCLITDNTQNTYVGDVDWSLIPEWAREMMKEATILRIAVNTQNYSQSKLNRLQFAVMLAKAMELEPVNVTADMKLFIDQTDIPKEDLGYIAALYNLGVIQGDNGAFRAERLVTRAEAAVMLTRVLDILQEGTAE